MGKTLRMARRLASYTGKKFVSKYTYSLVQYIENHRYETMYKQTLLSKHHYYGHYSVQDLQKLTQNTLASYSCIAVHTHAGSAIS